MSDCKCRDAPPHQVRRNTSSCLPAFVEVPVSAQRIETERTNRVRACCRINTQRRNLVSAQNMMLVPRSGYGTLSVVACRPTRIHQPPAPARRGFLCQQQMGCGMDRPRLPEADDEKSYDMGGGIALILAIVFIPILLIDFVAIIFAP